MSKKTYRTAQGKIIDLGAIQLKNEKTRAVGNMNVNARGDQIDANNKIVKSRTQNVNKTYNRQVGNVSDTPVVDQSKKLEEDPFGPMDQPTVEETNSKKDDGFSLT